MGHQLQGKVVRGPSRASGGALRWLREKRALKQYQLAEEAGVTKAMLSAYETGRQRPTLETLEKILACPGGRPRRSLRHPSDRQPPSAASPRYRSPRSLPQGRESPESTPRGPWNLSDSGGPERIRRCRPEETEALTALVEAHYRWMHDPSQDGSSARSELRSGPRGGISME